VKPTVLGRSEAKEEATPFAKGYAAHLKGRLDEAIALYGTAIQADPGHVRAYNNRGLAYQAKRDVNRAIADFSEAIRLSPTLNASFLNRGSAYAGKGDLDRAIADYTEAIRLEPKLSRAYAMRAAAYAAAGDKDKASADMLEAARTHVPRYDTVAHKAIRLEIDVKGPKFVPNYLMLDAILDEAKARIRRKKVYKENDALAVLQTIDAMLVERRFITADQGLLCDALMPRQVSQRMVNGMDPKKLRFRPRAGDSIFFSHPLPNSLIYAAIGEVLGIPIQIALAPGHTFVKWELADGVSLNWETSVGTVKSDAEFAARMRVSEAAVKNGVYLTPLSEEGLLAGVLTDVALVWSGEWLGLENEYQEKSDKNQGIRTEKAIAALTKAIELNKNHYEAYVQRAMYWSRINEHEKAIADDTQALTLDPTQPSAYFGRGLAYLAQGDSAKAVEDFDKAVEINPRLPTAYYFRGIAKAQNKEMEKSVEDLSKAIDLDPRFAEAYQARAKAWEMLGRKDKADADLNKAKALAPPKK
jgi:tetratricopeptide (TPR) repeat protein